MLTDRSFHAPEREAAPLDVTVLLLDDGLSSTAVMPLEIFHCAGALWNAWHERPAAPAFRVTTASLTGAPVRGGCGLDLKPACALNDIVRSDVVIVPVSGVPWNGKLVEDSVLPQWLQQQYVGGAYVAGACMGVAYLAEAGLLDGRMATTHWALSEAFAERYPKVNWRPELLVTEDSRTLCSGGVSAAIDVSLYLVEKLCGREVAVQCARALALPAPDALRFSDTLRSLSPPHDDDRIRAAEIYLQNTYTESISTDALANQAGLGVRSFARRFKAATGRQPSSYLQAVRIEAAKGLLERKASSVQVVGSSVGYDDVGFFRRLFKRETGMTPAEYRKHYSQLEAGMTRKMSAAGDRVN